MLTSDRGSSLIVSKEVEAVLDKYNLKGHIMVPFGVFSSSRGNFYPLE